MERRLLEKLDEVVEKFSELEKRLASSMDNHKELAEIGRQHSALEPLVEKYEEYKRVENEILSLKNDKYEDEELKILAYEEIEELSSRGLELESELKVMLLPVDPNDKKNVIVEIRAGAGGEEAAIFAADLLRMYQRYADSCGWSCEIIHFSEASAGGIKEVVLGVKGRNAYSKLKFESGVHRVQRIPKTEASGRIHTSTVTVSVLPEVDDVEISIEPKDLQIDVYRASGAGGQHVNTTDSAVRITHIPTGIVVTCQDERSQLKNREKAMRFLKAKLYAVESEKRRTEREKARKLQVGTGERSEKIRTYNYPQGRVTDHRINLTLHKLAAIMDGEIEEIIENLLSFDQAEKLKQGL